jgi:serine/threonine protein phosphatase PrpC
MTENQVRGPAFLSAPQRVDVPRFEDVLVPDSVEIRWGGQELGRPLAAVLEDGEATVSAPWLLAEVLRLVKGPIRALHEAHCHGIEPWGLRYHAGELFVAVSPSLIRGFGSGPPPLGNPATDDPIQRDLHLLGSHLFRAASGRWPGRGDDVTTFVDLCGGELPPGYDTALRLSIHPALDGRAKDTGRFATFVQPFLMHSNDSDLAFEVGVESVTGWQKAAGDPDGDNEDAFIWRRMPNGDILTSVIDGVTGEGDGSGRVAAQALRDRLAAVWEFVSDPRESLAYAHRLAKEQCHEWPYAAAAAVVARFGQDGLVQVAGAGDCRIYLGRRSGSTYRATSLLPEDSVAAEKSRAGERLVGGDRSTLTQCLVSEDAPDIHSANFSAQPGDRVLLASDGAMASTDRLFVEDLEALLDESFESVHLLVSRLCRRAEDLGGLDNATAMVVAVELTDTSTREEK